MTYCSDNVAAWNPDGKLGFKLLANRALLRALCCVVAVLVALLAGKDFLRTTLPFCGCPSGEALSGRGWRKIVVQGNGRSSRQGNI